jgi:hypothetical protein
MKALGIRRGHGVGNDGGTVDVAAADTNQSENEDSCKTAFTHQTHRHPGTLIHIGLKEEFNILIGKLTEGEASRPFSQTVDSAGFVVAFAAKADQAIAFLGFGCRCGAAGCFASEVFVVKIIYHKGHEGS